MSSSNLTSDLDDAFTYKTYNVFFPQHEYEVQDAYKFCCDECDICFSTHLAADFHELEVHEDRFCVKTYISKATKKIFANMLRISR